MLGVCDRVADDLEQRKLEQEARQLCRSTHVLEEDLEDTTGLLVDETGDTLDTATAGKTTDSGLGDTCEQDEERPNAALKGYSPWMLSRRILR